MNYRIFFDRSSFRSYLFLATLVILVSAGCKKFVDIPPPVNELVSEVVFNNDASATSAVTGIYSEMMSSANPATQFSASGITFYAGMSADEFLYYSNTTKQEFVRDQITEQNHNIISSLFWDRAYKYIYTANLCLEQLGKSGGEITDSIKVELMGECKFIRAFCFFHLVNLFGGVPLTVTSDYTVTSTLPRADTEAVYQTMIRDLLDAKDWLWKEYPSPGRVRPNQSAAMALLARVYLYHHEWANAEMYATKVLSESRYSLVTDLNSVFLKNSNEAIWQLMPVNTFIYNTYEGNILIPATNGSSPNYVLTDGLMSAFEPGDLRRTSWVATRVYQGVTINYPYKYKVRTSSPPSIEYYMVLRLAEQYLVRAEARIQQNNIQGAQDDLNAIRTRAGLTNTTESTKDGLVAAIEKERRIELFAEWGHRWYDLKRTGRVDPVLRALKPTWDLHAALWPIPVTQLRANAALVQNPGY